MLRSEVLSLYEEKKTEFFRDVTSDVAPVGILLGGQAAVGKGQLNLWAEKLYKEKSFLSINGDNYRSRHPQFNELRRNVWSYSNETQIFSNVFTEKLIEESVDRRVSIVIEGTMRNPDVPLKTSDILRKSGYVTAAFAISAPREFSMMSIFSRYYREIVSKGFGRMVDISSHNAAIAGLPASLDRLYIEKAVDRICIFDCFARNLVAEYRLNNGKWDSKVLPSEVIQASRERQLKDNVIIEELLSTGETALRNLDGEIQEKAKLAYQDLQSIRNILA